MTFGTTGTRRKTARHPDKGGNPKAKRWLAVWAEPDGREATRAFTGADGKTVQARLRHASAKTTLDTYGHLWPDRGQSTRATVQAVFVTRRTEQGLNQQGAR